MKKKLVYQSMKKKSLGFIFEALEREKMKKKENRKEAEDKY